MLSSRLPAISGNALLGGATLAVALLLLPALGRYAASREPPPVPAATATAVPSILPSPIPSGALENGSRAVPVAPRYILTVAVPSNSAPHAAYLRIER